MFVPIYVPFSSVTWLLGPTQPGHPSHRVTLRSSVMGFQSIKSYTHLYLVYLCGVEVEADIVSQLQHQFLHRLGLDKEPKPSDDVEKLRHVPDFLKQLMAGRSRLMTSSSPDQSPLSALAISPRLGKLMFRLLIHYI